MKKTNLCGIFATLFVATTIVLLASCSQDDDYYESDMYTLAERGTRLGGEPEIYDNGIEQNTFISGEENCCGLYTLIARSIEMYGRQAFMNDGIHTPLNAKVTMFADANDRVRQVRHRSRGLRAPCREAPPRCFS